MGSAIGKSVLVVVAVIAVVFAIWGAATGFRYWSAGVRGKVDAQEQILSGDSRIANYDHFFDLCKSVQQVEYAIDAQQDELATAETVDDRARIQANIAGLKAARADAIATYNADASKSYTVGRFRSSHLPFNLNPAPYSKGAYTVCAV